MASTFKNVLMMIFAGEFIAGLLGNGFIILVYCIDWIRSWKFFLIDFILTCLAISRILLLCIIMLGIGIDIICEEICYNDNQWMTFEILWTGSNYFCITCTACLSVFYLLKIANFPIPLSSGLNRELTDCFSLLSWERSSLSVCPCFLRIQYLRT